MNSPEPSTNRCTPLCTLHVCTSCRRAGTPREPKENRQGFQLYQKLVELFESSPLIHQVDIQPAQCLSICPRPCGIALSAHDSWTYLFGDQKPDETAQNILDCISLYLTVPDGFMPRANRPRSLQRSILGRVPPKIGESTCT